MNKSRHLLLSALALCSGLSATAQSFNAPSLKFSDFSDGDTVYLYNEKAQLFLASGGNYSAQTVLSQRGIKIAPEKVGEQNGEALYFLWNNSPTHRPDAPSKNGWVKIFVESTTNNGASWVDWLDQPGDTFKIKSVGDQTYNIQTTYQSSYGETYMGWLGDPTNNLVYPCLDPIDEFFADYGIDWKIVKADKEADKYPSKLNLYNKLVQAQSNGNIKIDDIVALYNDDATTSAQLDSLSNLVDYRIRYNDISWADASGNNPIDISTLISNADCSSLAGWEAWRAPGNGTNWQTQGSSYSSGLSSISNFIERWVSTPGANDEGTSVGLSDGYLRQTLHDLPNGIYTLVADVIGVQQHTPNYTENNGTALYLATGDNFADSVSVNVSTVDQKPEHKSITINVTNGELRFGFATHNTQNNWIAIDNVRIVYTGQDLTPMISELQTAIDQASELSNTPSNETDQDEFYDAIDAASDVANAGNNGNTIATVSKATEDLRNAVKAYQASIDAYKALAAAVTEGQRVYDAHNGESRYTLMPKLDEYLHKNTEAKDEDGNPQALSDVVKNYTVRGTLAQHLADSLTNLTQEVLYSGIEAGHECTFVIEDPHFKNGGRGWVNPQTVDATYHDCEAYNKNFNTYVTLTDLPNGKYTVRMQAFQRIGSNDNAYNDYTRNGDKNISAIIYANDNSVKVKNIMADAASKSYTQDSTGLSPNGVIPADYRTPAGKYTPNSMQGAHYYFANDLYWNEVSAIVTDGTLKLGIRDDNHVNGGWVLFDNVQLVYDGTSYEVLKPVADELNVLADSLAQQPMNADSLSNLKTALSNLNELTAGGQDMVKAIGNVENALNKARTSIAYYSPLATEVENAKATANDPANARTKAQPSEAYSAVENKMNQGGYADAEISDAIVELKSDLNTYLMSDVVSDNTVSETNPADVSFVLQSPNFAGNKATGWVKTVAGAVNYECQEFFNTNYDIHQVLYGMPAGKYRLVAQGFYRDGSYANHMRQQSNGNLVVNSFIYINDEQNEIASIDKGIRDITDLTGGSTAGLIAWDTSSDPILYGPDNMRTAELFFSDDSTSYLSNVEYTLDAAGNLTVGAKKTTTVVNDWTIFDHFSLYYLGNGSTTGINGITTDATEAGVVKTEYFDITGAKVNGLQRGVNIVKQTLKDGSVKVKKVITK